MLALVHSYHEFLSASNITIYKYVLYIYSSMVVISHFFNRNISTMSKTAGGYPQDSYSAVVRVVQSEWIFLQLVTWYMGDTFTGVEKIVWENFLPHLFFGKKKILSLIVGPLSTMTIKMAVLGILNPVASAK